MMLEKVYFCAVFFVSGMAIEYSKFDQGISNGFLPDCPGFQKPVIIKPKSLEKISISVVGPGNILEAKWTKYKYHNIWKLINDTQMDLKKKTLVYVPAYLEIMPSIGGTLGTLYKEMGYNVLILNYLHFIVKPFPLAARMAFPVAQHVGEILANLTTLGLDPKKLEMLGLSLGSQIMGLAAKKYRSITGQNISSLTALDPTGPCFRHLGPDQRLDPSDADFVLTMHTNIDGFGIATPLGHVSMFVNGGEYQGSELWTLPCTIYCSHTRSYFLWMSALMNPGSFVAMQCDSVQQARDADCYDRKPKVTNTMDLFTDKSKPGIYYLGTSNRYPYALGRKGLDKNQNLFLKHFKWLYADDVIVV